MSKDMLSFSGPVKEIKILDPQGKPLLGGDQTEDFSKLPGCTNTRGSITSHTQPVTLTLSLTPQVPAQPDLLPIKA